MPYFYVHLFRVKLTPVFVSFVGNPGSSVTYSGIPTPDYGSRVDRCQSDTAFRRMNKTVQT